MASVDRSQMVYRSARREFNLIALDSMSMFVCYEISIQKIFTYIHVQITSHSI